MLPGLPPSISSLFSLFEDHINKKQECDVQYKTYCKYLSQHGIFVDWSLLFLNFLFLLEDTQL